MVQIKGDTVVTIEPDPTEDTLALGTQIEEFPEIMGMIAMPYVIDSTLNTIEPRRLVVLPIMLKVYHA